VLLCEPEVSIRKVNCKRIFKEKRTMDIEYYLNYISIPGVIISLVMLYTETPDFNDDVKDIFNRMARFLLAGSLLHCAWLFPIIQIRMLMQFIVVSTICVLFMYDIIRSLIILNIRQRDHWEDIDIVIRGEINTIVHKTKKIFTYLSIVC
jgi:hypothetical protein